MIRYLLLLACAAAPSFAEEAAIPPAPPRPVLSELVTEGAIRQRVFAGIIEAEVTSTLAFQTLGRLASLPVAAGDRVRAGDALATLDQVTLQEDVAAATAALAGARAEAVLAEQTLARAQELVRRGVSSAAQLEAAQSARDSAVTQVTSAEADLERAEDAARFGTLSAPMDGIVLSTAAEPGSVVSPGTPILTLAGLTGREAVIDVPTEFLTFLKPGTTFELQGHGTSAVPITGTLRLIEPTADAGTRSRRLRLSLGDIPPAYRLGSLISARLAGPEPGTVAGIMTLPATAITGTADAPAVWRVGEGRILQLVPVTLGRSLGSRVEIAAGIAPGEEIVVKGVNSVTEGQTVGRRIE